MIREMESMKKLLAGFGLSAMLAMGLVGCSEEATDTSSDTKVESEAKDEASAPVEEVETTDARTEYADYYTPLLSDFSTNMAEFSDLLVNVSPGDLTVRATWYDNVMAKSDELDGIIEDMRNYDGDIPDGIDHDALMLALDEYQHIPDDLPSALDIMYASGGTGGISEMNAITEHIVSGNDYLSTFTASFTE